MTTGPQEILSVDVACDAGAPGAVRSALAGLACLGDDHDDVMLVASELVTNAVVHSGCIHDDLLAVRASISGDQLTISVHDPGVSEQAAQPRGDAGAGGGWGLRIVEKLATRWGSHRNDGYRVWAELPLVTAG